MQAPISIQMSSPNDPIYGDNLSLSSPPQFSNSCKTSPKLSYIQSDSSIKKAWTAPTSPISSYTYNNYDNYNNFCLNRNIMTPQPSPTFLENSSLQLPRLKNKLNQTFTKQNVVLPSLRHLQLLPDPRVQEYSYIYPDTSEKTPLWKNNLLSWCKYKKYQDYVSIKEQNIKTRNYYTTTVTNTPSSSTTAEGGFLKEFQNAKIPSILQVKDPFYGLSNKPWEFQSPLTPPMSPKKTSQPTLDENNNDNTNNNTEQNDNLNNNSKRYDIFNPIISEKLVQYVKKQQRTNLNGINKSTSSISTHKKTNSFKALQIKKMLMDRDVLSINSKKYSKVNKHKNNNNICFKNLSSNTVITNFVKSPATTITNTTTKVNSNTNNNTNDNNVFRPTNNGTTTTTTLLSSPTLIPCVSRPVSPMRRKKSGDNKIPNGHTVRSRTRSRSPVRIVNFSNTTTRTPPPSSSLQYNNGSDDHQKNSYSLPRYHTFSLSRASSPIYSTQPTNNNDNNIHYKNSIYNSHNTNNYSNNVMLYSINSNKKLSSTAAQRSHSAPTSTTTSPLRGKGTRHSHTTGIRKCVSCDSHDSPCWRPSWSKNRQDQLCNSCGLRYKKTKTRCLNMKCKKIPTKSELNIMKSQGKITGTVANNPAIIGPVVGYRCLFCNSITETLD